MGPWVEGEGCRQEPVMGVPAHLEPAFIDSILGSRWKL